MNKNEENTQKNTISPELIKDNLAEICKILTYSDDKLAYEFLECLLTPTERREMAQRWILVKELDNGRTQREIAKEYGMSLCKITRGSRELKKDNSAFRRMLDILDKQSREK